LRPLEDCEEWARLLADSSDGETRSPWMAKNRSSCAHLERSIGIDRDEHLDPRRQQTPMNAATIKHFWAWVIPRHSVFGLDFSAGFANLQRMAPNCEQNRAVLHLDGTFTAAFQARLHMVTERRRMCRSRSDRFDRAQEERSNPTTFRKETAN